MVIVPFYILYWKASFRAELACESLEPFLREEAGIAEVGVGSRQRRQAIAGQMKTRVAAIAVEHLITVLIGRAEADFAVSFKKLFASFFALGRFLVTLCFQKLS